MDLGTLEAQFLPPIRYIHRQEAKLCKIFISAKVAQIHKILVLQILLHTFGGR